MSNSYRSFRYITKKVLERILEKKQLVNDIIKDNAFRIMNKIDTQIPVYVKIQSDLYREYRHIVEDFFKAGNVLEGNKANMLPRDQLSKNIIEYNVRIYSNVALVGLDMYGEYLKWYAGVRLAAMKSIDQAIHNCMAMSGMPINTSKPDTNASSTVTKKQTRTRRNSRRSS